MSISLSTHPNQSCSYSLLLLADILCQPIRENPTNRFGFEINLKIYKSYPECLLGDIFSRIKVFLNTFVFPFLLFLSSLEKWGYSKKVTNLGCSVVLILNRTQQIVLTYLGFFSFICCLIQQNGGIFTCVNFC